MSGVPFPMDKFNGRFLTIGFPTNRSLTNRFLTNRFLTNRAHRGRGGRCKDWGDKALTLLEDST